MAGKLGGVVVLVVAGALVGGCGSTESNHLKAAPTEGKPGKQLRGTYTATVPKSVLPASALHMIKAPSASWKLRIAPTGGPNNTPTITITNSKSGVLESSRLGVQTGTLLIHDEACRATKGSVDSLYRYRIAGKQLRIGKFRNGCPDKLTESVLTAHPWKKQGS